MTIMPDSWIREKAHKDDMIDPFIEVYEKPIFTKSGI